MYCKTVYGHRVLECFHSNKLFQVFNLFIDHAWLYIGSSNKFEGSINEESPFCTKISIAMSFGRMNSKIK